MNETSPINVTKVAPLAGVSIGSADALLSGGVEAFLGAADGRTPGGMPGASLTIGSPVTVLAYSDMDATASADGTGASVGVSLTVMEPGARERR